MLQHKLYSDVNTTTLNTSGLDRILEYKNEDLIYKFTMEWNLSPDEAKEIFEETKKFIYLASTCQEECFNITIHEQIQVIDEMWHTFIQFTDKYHNFCTTYLGGFLHHFPFTREMLRKEIKHVSMNNTSFEDYKTQAYVSQIGKIKEKLGEETVIKWYADFATRYSIEKLNNLRLPIKFGDNPPAVSLPVDILSKSKDEILKIVMGVFDSNRGCGCSGKGCGSGCSCNSR
ncbi:Uncharacterized conserved protein [Serratia plymuthica]|nr:Uncharacterized conserved protein [Serratia plymuthica]